MFRRKGKKNFKEFFSCLEVWLRLFFKVFFIYKYIKIIYIFLFFKKLFLIPTHQNNLKILN